MSKKVQLPVISERDYGRIMSGLRERKRRLERGIAKFGDDFDPEKGQNMTDALTAYKHLIENLEEETVDV